MLPVLGSLGIVGKVLIYEIMTAAEFHNESVFASCSVVSNRLLRDSQ